MKSISPSLQNHLEGELATLAHLVKITRRDGTVLGFTGHDRNLVVNSVLYRADSAFSASAIHSRSDLSTDNLDIIGMLADDALAEADIRAGRYDHARIDIYLCNWADLSQGTLQLRRGWLGEIALEGGQYRAEMRGLQDLLQRPVGHVFTPECRHQLGDAACGVNLAPLTVTGAVSAPDDQHRFIDGTRTEPAGRFSGGLLTWTSGANAGMKGEIKDYISGQFTLWLPEPYAIALGDAYSAVPGCDKRYATCRTSFNNLVNFGGFPHMPGVDRLLNYPDAR